MNSEINGNTVIRVNIKRTHDQVMVSPNKTSPKSDTATWPNKRHGDQISGSPPKKKIKNGAPTPQPKNSVAMLNELRQGLIYTLEGQSGPVHAPIFTMSVEVLSSIFGYHFINLIHNKRRNRLMVKNIMDKDEARKLLVSKQLKLHYEVLFNLKTELFCHHQSHQTMLISLVTSIWRTV